MYDNKIIIIILNIIYPILSLYNISLTTIGMNNCDFCKILYTEYIGKPINILIDDYIAIEYNDYQYKNNCLYIHSNKSVINIILVWNDSLGEEDIIIDSTNILTSTDINYDQRRLEENEIQSSIDIFITDETDQLGEFFTNKDDQTQLIDAQSSFPDSYTIQETTNIILKKIKLNARKMFENCDVIQTINFINFENIRVYNMEYMFYNCNKLNSLKMKFNTYQLNNIQFMFFNCSNLISIELNFFDTSSVTNMRYMFYDCSKLETLNLYNFSTFKVLNMEYMFSRCIGLNNINLSNFDVSEVRDMSYMFADCSSLKEINISDFNCKNAENMTHMFYNCNEIVSLNINNFITYNVKYMDYMFSNCYNLTSLDLKNFHFAENMEHMFENCTKLISVDLINIEDSNIKNTEFTEYIYDSYFISDNIDINILFFKCILNLLFVIIIK